MRLIDADTLYNGAMKDEWFRFKERDNNGKESFAYSCAMQRLVEAPTVDAIPVEWIREKRDALNVMKPGSMSEKLLTKLLMVWHWEQCEKEAGL